MPNIRSAKKRVKVSATKTATNKARKSNLKTMIKKADAACAANAADKEAAVRVAIKRVDQACAKGLMHKNAAARRKLVNTMISENGYPEETLSISSLGIISAISGGCLYVIIPHLGIKRTFYIDEDKHVFKGESHTMTLTLNFATDIGAAG